MVVIRNDGQYFGTYKSYAEPKKDSAEPKKDSA